MKENPRILVVDPHPDDEAILWGGTIAKYAGLGAEIYLLVLTNGEKGKIAITHPERGLQGYREVKSEEENWLATERRKECLEAAGILGVKQVEFLGIPNLGVDQNAIFSIKTAIKKLDPHVIFSFNEAGTTASQDHAWAGIATFHAILSLLKDTYGDIKLGSTRTLTGQARPLSFRRFLTYHLLNAGQLLEKWAELNVSPRDLTFIDVTEELDIKRSASYTHQTQRHLVDFFDRVGILGMTQEPFYERICIGPSCKGEMDFLHGIEEPPTQLAITIFPEEQTKYASTMLNYYDVIQRRCQIASSLTLIF